ncbi:NUDIX hydrolase [Mycobacteroides franklinii]|uniref:NUDIX hydrolase n=1 Tax=Mycobacteroides franklinii TaxID=948102 RepID=UPI0009F72DF2|nr:NUDIX hydrolase [Mycobacteroides franklinii]
MSFSVGVAGIVINETDVLIIQRADSGTWESSGGVLEHGETFVEGVRREVLEETGVIVDVHELAVCYLNTSKHVVALAFRCTPQSGTPRPGAESLAVQWVPVAEAVARLNPVFAIRVSDALRPSGQPAVCHHDGVTLIDCRPQGR